MRLIDKDRLLKGTNHYWLEMEKFGDIEMIDVRFIEMAEEIKAIPIDKPFLKMRYGDYVLYNKKWLVDHLQTEWNILQGKEYRPSIPVEWIKKWLNETEDDRIVCFDIRDMLADWEKENEQNKENISQTDQEN